MKRHDVYKCSICGNIIEVVNPSAPALVCCGKPMDLQTEHSADLTTEKHVPVIEKTANGIKVVVGSTAHPMEEKHYIQWIQVIAGDRVYMKYLKPGMKPEAEFPVTTSPIKVREYCNLHGLWVNKA